MIDGKVEERETARWNLTANVLDGALFSLGLSFVSQQAILPLFVRHIGGGSIEVGLLPVIWTLGFNMPQILSAGHAERSVRKKGLLLRTAVGQRLPWLLLALASFFAFGSMGPGPALLLFFFLYMLAAVGGALNLPVWFDLVATLTPVQSRGRLFAWRSVLGSILGILGGACASVVLGAIAPPESYGFLFLLAFLSMGASYVCLALLKEGPAATPRDPGPRTQWTREIRRLLRERPNLRNFLVADALQISAGMGLAFYAVYAVEKFQLPDTSAGMFTVIMMVSMILSGQLFGKLADSRGHKINLLLANVATVISSVIAMLAPGPLSYGLVFVAASMTIALTQISRLPMIAELATAQDRPTVIAVANIVTAPFVCWGVIGGVLAGIAGYTLVFALAAVFALAGFVWLHTMVTEPRAAAITSPLEIP